MALNQRKSRIESQLEAVKRRIEEATEKHKEQIRKSLTSKNPEEREMAERIADWWNVSTDTE